MSKTFIDKSQLKAIISGISLDSTSGEIQITFDASGLATAAATTATNKLKLDGSNAMTGNLNAGSNRVINVSSPTGANDAATKAYVDALVTRGELVAVTVVQTTNQTSLTGLPTVDGQTLTDSQIILLTGQTTGSQNGPWLVHSGAWTRPTWYATGTTVAGILAIVELGTVYAGSSWVLTGSADVVDTTATTWVQEQIRILAGNGISMSGNTVSAAVDNTTIGFSGSNLAGLLFKNKDKFTGDGTTVQFTTTAPVGGLLMVFYDGILQDDGASNDYTTSLSGGNTRVTFGTAPVNLAKITLCY